MDISQIARSEVDGSLDEWRARTEHGIANGRLVFYGGMAAIAALGFLHGREIHPFPAPVIWYLGWVGVALFLRQAQKRIAASTGWIVVTIFSDVGSVALTGWALHSLEVASAGYTGVASQPSGAENLFFVGVMVLQLVIFASAHALRSEAKFAWIAYGVAGAGFLVDRIVRLKGLDPLAVASAFTDGTGRWQRFASASTVITFLAFLIAARIAAHAANATRDRMFALARLTILKRMVPAAAVARVGSAASREVSLAGERVTVTLLASDLRGFTALSEKLSPEQIVRELNDYHASMLQVIERHGGLLDKFIGDGALVVFGPDATDDGANAAVACAREMLDALVRHNKDRASRSLDPLAIGVGIHTGTVISGVIGAGARLEWTVIGDAVNTAARLESLTKEEKVPVLVSAQTVSRLSGDHGLRDLGERAVRGRVETVHLYAIEPVRALVIAAPG